MAMDHGGRMRRRLGVEEVKRAKVDLAEAVRVVDNGSLPLVVQFDAAEMATHALKRTSLRTTSEAIKVRSVLNSIFIKQH